MTIVVIWPRFGPYHLARLRGLAEHAARAGFSVVGLEVAQRDHYPWDVRTGAEGFRRRTLFPGRDYGSLSAFAIQSAVTRALGEIKPRAVAVNGWGVPETHAAIGWCRFDGVPAVLMSETKEDDRGGRRTWWKEAIKGLLVRRCDAALVGGRRQSDYLIKLGFPGDRIFTGYNAVDNDYFAREAARARANAQVLRERRRLPERYFFACTRFLARKNLDGLLRAHGLYRKRCTGTPWPLVIAGAGEEEDNLRRLERRLGLSDIHWSGFLQYEQLPVFLGLAGAFVHPALTEPWGLVVNEAAAAGLPLLVSRTVGAGYELLAEGENGLAFDPEDPADMARALGEMAATPEEARAGMGAKSATLVADRSPARFGEGLLAAVRAAGVV